MPKLALLILDGWGDRKSKAFNAIAKARTPNLNQLYNTAAHTLLNAAGPAVGLPNGVMGNSEVGHLTLGAGRVVKTDLVRINRSIQDGSFYKNKELLHAINHAKKRNHKLHVMGLLSDAGVHSHVNHLFALLKLCKQQNFHEVYIHAFLDGRDTPPTSGINYIKQLQRFSIKNNIGTLATITGRYFAMDRDNRWNREHKAYDVMVNCKGRYADDPIKLLQDCYKNGETDEFIKPTLLLKKCVVDEHDSVIFFNFRSDRARELTRAFVSGSFNEFQRKEIIDLCFVTLTQYEKSLHVPVAFPPIIPKQTLGEIIDRAKLRQLRIAETEKWAHVTYFFNGLCECIFKNEDRIHIPSRKVTTYDKTPAMKAKQIADSLLVNQDKYDFFVVNIANGDMVGHTGDMMATIRALEAVDEQVGRIVAEFKGLVCITADHGNCEEMNGKYITSHTTNKVPFLVIGKDCKLHEGGLSDVAPTILELMKIQKPKEMTGKSLLMNNGISIQPNPSNRTRVKLEGLNFDPY